VTIKLDGEFLLRVLARWGDALDADFGRLGHNRVESSEVHRSRLSPWSILRYNDAIKWLLKRGYIEDDETLGSAPYEMRSLLLTTDGRMAAEPLVSGIDMGAVRKVNANARRLLVHLHGLYLAVRGKQFSSTPDGITLTYLGFDQGTYMQAGHRLIERGLAKWVSNGGSLTITQLGLRTVESPDQVAHELPVSADDEEEEGEQAMASKPDRKMAAVYALNQNARTLLARLHDARLKVGGKDFTFFYSEDLPFDYESYKAAALRLTERNLAEYKGQTEITITALGVQASEDDGATLDRLLPLEPSEKRLKMSGKSIARTNGKIYIGHGGASAWRDLKDFIHERLHLPWEEFNRESAAGMPTIKRLEDMLDASSFAFLVMTAEDEQADGTKHARANVIHEVGLFQGRLGFERAIVLLEEGCEEFSNIHGLTQIRFPKGNVSAKFEEIRKVLEREGILVAGGALSGVSPRDPFPSGP
jgi:predicted nucleotide-binding protein